LAFFPNFLADTALTSKPVDKHNSGQLVKHTGVWYQDDSFQIRGRTALGKKEKLKDSAQEQDLRRRRCIKDKHLETANLHVTYDEKKIQWV